VATVRFAKIQNPEAPVSAGRARRPCCEAPIGAVLVFLCRERTPHTIFIGSELSVLHPPRSAPKLPLTPGSFDLEVMSTRAVAAGPEVINCVGRVRLPGACPRLVIQGACVKFARSGQLGRNSDGIWLVSGWLNPAQDCRVPGFHVQMSFSREAAHGLAAKLIRAPGCHRGHVFPSEIMLDGTPPSSSSAPPLRFRWQLITSNLG
jgi:hypothetical protein